MRVAVGAQAPVIPPYLLAYLVEIARAEGWDHAPWFTGTGIDAERVLSEGARVSFDQAARIIARAVAAAPEPALGLRMGARQTLTSCGVLGLALMSAPTAAAALAATCRFHPVTGSVLNLHVTRHAGEAALVASERFPCAAILPFACEEMFAAILAIARALGPPVRLTRLDLTYAEPPYAAAYADHFGCDIAFRRPANRMVFDAAFLATPLPNADPLTHATALRLCEPELAACTPPASIADQLRAWLRAAPSGPPNIAEAAKHLHVSERTLRRHLASCGTSFRALIDADRADRARQLLARADTTVSEVAYDVGFSDSREFRRAFKRWTGKVPSAVR